MSRNPLRLAVLATVVLAAACAHAPRHQEVVWPLPPAKPRIRFVDTFATGADLDRSGWARFKRTVFGGKELGLKQPIGIAVSDDGDRVYLADAMHGAVLKADLAAKTLRPFAPKALVASAAGVALDPDENVYITDPKKREVVVVTRAGERLRQFGAGELVRPLGIAIDRVNRLVYVVDTGNQKGDGHRVLVYDLEGRPVRELGPAGGDRPGRGDLDGQFHFPTYVAVDGGGTVYVADSLNFRIQAFDASGKLLTTAGVQGDAPGSFSRLKGLAIDGFGNLHAVDAEHASVQIFNKGFDLLMYFGGPAPFVEMMDLPGAIAIDRTRNRIYVCMEGTPRVNVYELVNTRPEDSVAAPAAAASAR